MKPRLSMMIAASAEQAFGAFVDVERVPDWLSVVRQAEVLERDPEGLPVRVAFRSIVGGLEVPFELRYENDRERHRTRWATVPQSARRFEGSAEFEPLGERRCLFHYEIAEEASNAVPDPAALPVWTDDAWVAMKHFGDWVTRRLKRQR